MNQLRGRNVDNRRRIMIGYIPVVTGLALALIVVILFPSQIPSNLTINLPLNFKLIPSNDLPGMAGKTVSGIECGPGIRQIPWSSYSPMCQPNFHGNNGGSTSYGVTGKTITVTFRYALPPEYQALVGLLGGSSVIGNEQDAIATMQSYINFFNSQFELYGRKVVLKAFTGKGNLLTELSGSGIPEAQADAATAKSLGAFADVSLIFSTPVYDQVLAQNHIVAITGSLFQDAQWFDQNSPFVYSTTATCDMVSKAAAAIIGNSMAGLPAIFSNSPILRVRKRVLGLIAPDNPQYQGCAKEALDYLSKYGVKIVKSIGYPFSLTGATQLSTNTVEQLVSAGVTTIMCACDPITPIFLAGDASSLQYYPEWFTLDWGDGFAQIVSKNEWAGALSGGQPSIPKADQESYKALLLAHVPKNQINPLYSSIYAPLIMLFDAIQAAGPDLTPQTFEHGFWSLPPSVGSLNGMWQFHTGSYVAQASYEIMQYDPNIVSNDDGKSGAWTACNSGKLYFYSNPTLGLKKGTQLNCPFRKQ